MILFWAALLLLFLVAITAAGILMDPELAASEFRAAARWLACRLDRHERLSLLLDRWERRALIFASLLVLLVDGEAATR